ncbi:MAG: hypothetical protein ACKVUS_07785 [Saprospiraceae bacterium]
MKKIFLLPTVAKATAGIAFLLLAFCLSAQEKQPLLNVFLDSYAAPYHPDFLRNEIQFVNYVSDRSLSDVQLQAVAEPVGNGATRYRYLFFGYGRFEGQNDTITWHSDPAENSGSIREKSLRAFKQGLFRYILQTPLGQSLDYEVGTEVANADTPDPWNRWTFSPGLEVYSDGSFYRRKGTLFGGTNTEQGSFWANPSFSAWRIGHKWRFGAAVDYSYLHRWMLTTDGSNPAEPFTERHFTADFSGVYALAPRWSVGASLGGEKRWSSTNDYPSRVAAGLGIEYSFLPYRHYFRKRLAMGYAWRQNLGDENFSFFSAGHQIFATGGKVARWGFLNAALSGTMDFDKYDWRYLGANGNIQAGVNVKKNFYLTFQMRTNWSWGRRSSPSVIGFPAIDERIRSGSYQYSLGFAYFFGSGYRNVINPRMTGFF